MKTAFIVVLALCATLAAAHDKMTVPITRTGTEVTVNGGDGVCDAAPDNNNVPNSANAGDTINIQWDGNHGGPWTVTWAKMSDSTDEAILDENRRTIQNGLSTSLRWPSNLETGTYTVQWTWSNYRSCADFNIAALPIPTNVPVGSYYTEDGQLVDEFGVPYEFDAETGECISDNCPSSGSAGVVILVIFIVGLVGAIVGGAFYFVKVRGGASSGGLPTSYSASNAGPTNNVTYSEKPFSHGPGSSGPSTAPRPPSSQQGSFRPPVSHRPAPSYGAPQNSGYGAPQNSGYGAPRGPGPSGYGASRGPQMGRL